MKRRIVRKRSRRQTALFAMAWFVFLFAFNLVFNVVAIFPFQGRQNMENRMEIDKTEVIWRAPTKSYNGYTNCLVINEALAVFTSYRFHWKYGWMFDQATLVSRNTKEPMSHGYSRVGNSAYGEAHLMGYVNSDEVDTIEYFYRWEDGYVKTVRIREDSFLYHNGETYYWQVEDDSIWDHLELDEKGNVIEVIDLLEKSVRALDRDGNVIYQGPMEN